jgi:gelsolin
MSYLITKFSTVALLKRQGFNFKGPAKAAPVKQEPQPQIDCTGNLQVC